MFKKFFLIILIFFINNSWSSNLKKDNFSFEDIQKIDYMINNNDYYEFYKFLNENKINEDNYIKFLNSKKDLGITPIYWLMADFYSNKNNEEYNTMFWILTSIIMTEQDSSLCVDKSSYKSLKVLSNHFKKPVDFYIKNNHLEKEIMPKVNFFISNLKFRNNPSWTCNFSENKNIKKENQLIPKKLWENNRYLILKKYTENFYN